jgi:plasmid stabilization system protein ParE
MNFQVKISEYAKDDLETAYEFYETHANNLGQYFIDNILSEIEMLEFYGCLHQKYYGFHRMISKKFPYAIYYNCDKDKKEIIVIAVLDLRRNPNTIKKYLKDRK